MKKADQLGRQQRFEAISGEGNGKARNWVEIVTHAARFRGLEDHGTTASNYLTGQQKG